MCLLLLSSSFLLSLCLCVLVSPPFPLPYPRAARARGLRRARPRHKHSCHILPFRPILRNRYFPPEPAKTAQTAPNLFQRGVEYDKYDKIAYYHIFAGRANGYYKTAFTGLLTTRPPTCILLDWANARAKSILPAAAPAAPQPHSRGSCHVMSCQAISYEFIGSGQVS